MTLYYPDIASFQAGIDLSGALVVCSKITEGTGYVNPYFTAFKNEAAASGSFFFAYHFLTQGNGAGQASFAYSHAGKLPLMLDFEPEKNSNPTVADAVAFIDAYRKAGGICWFLYLPKWYWQQLGSPSLKPFTDRGMLLVSSAYTTYTDADSGAGWQSYGGMTPTVWQYSSTVNFGGIADVDFNAFRGSKYAGKQDAASVAATLKEFKSLVTTGRYPVVLTASYGPVLGVGTSPTADVVVSWNPPSPVIGLPAQPAAYRIFLHSLPEDTGVAGFPVNVPGTQTSIKLSLPRGQTFSINIVPQTTADGTAIDPRAGGDFTV